jgi:hypothetical protein
MQLIFSRKGFDSTYGGGASPILPDGTMLSIPIPEENSGIRYADLQTPRGPLLKLMLELSINRYKENRRFGILSGQSKRSFAARRNGRGCVIPISLASCSALKPPGK